MGGDGMRRVGAVLCLILVAVALFAQTGKHRKALGLAPGCSYLIQSAHGSNTTTIPLSQPTTAHSLMVIALTVTDGGSSGPINPSDDQPSGNGNDYARTRGGSSGALWYLFPVSDNLGGANNVIIHAVTAPTVVDTWVFELNGPGTDDDDDSEVGGPGPTFNPTTPPISASAPRDEPYPGVSNGEFFITEVEVADAGGTITSVSDGTWTLAPVQRGNAVAYKFANGTVDEQATFTNSLSTTYEAIGADYFTVCR